VDGLVNRLVSATTSHSDLVNTVCIGKLRMYSIERLPVCAVIVLFLMLIVTTERLLSLLTIKSKAKSSTEQPRSINSDNLS